MKRDSKFEKVLDYIGTSPWKDDSDTEIIIKQAYKVYKNITINKDKGNSLFRLCGQTGSGKTTQLLKAFEMYMENKKRNPVILGVRTCANYHPQYDELLAQYGNGQIREITNGFALKCMTYVLKLLIENNYLILLDITLLDPIYEEYILDLVKENNYKVEYHVMAVNKKISDGFIKKRYEETGRIVSDSSCEYFNYILDKGLLYICNNDFNNYCYIWNAYDSEPKFFGLVNNCFDSFNKEKKIIKEPFSDEKTLLNAKYKVLLNRD